MLWHLVNWDTVSNSKRKGGLDIGKCKEINLSAHSESFSALAALFQRNQSYNARKIWFQTSYGV